MAAALRTLPALDGLLQQLAEAAGRELHQQELLRLRQSSGGDSGGGSGGKGQALVPVSHVTAIMPFTAAALGTARTVSSRLQPPHQARAC
jgi:hypothetical protein